VGPFVISFTVSSRGILVVPRHFAHAAAQKRAIKESGWNSQSRLDCG